MPDFSLMIVDQNEQECLQLKNYFAEQGFSVNYTTDYSDAAALLLKGKRGPDLMILSCGSPDEEIFHLLDHRRPDRKIAVVILSADSRIESQLAFYEKGIDELIVKPMHISLVQAHIEAVLRRVGGHQVTEETVGELTLNYDSRKAYIAGKKIRVTTKEFELLECFIRNRGVTLSRDKILDAVWGYDYVGSYRSVDTLVKKIRAKLTSKYPYIKTVYGVGYCFDIQEDADDED